MRTAELFTGKAFIEVHEGSIFRVDGNWSWEIGSKVIFQVKAGVKVETFVRMKDGLGTEFIVDRIVAEDELGEISVEAKDVEVEVESHVEVEPQVEIDHKIILNKKKFTKKEIVAFIKENSLDIDTSLSKANLIKVLEEKNLVEYV